MIDLPIDEYLDLGIITVDDIFFKVLNDDEKNLKLMDDFNNFLQLNVASKNPSYEEVYRYPYYFFYYYVKREYARFGSNYVSNDTSRFVEQVLQFKDGRNQEFFTQIVIEKLKSDLDDLSNTIFLCIPASTAEKNKVRFENFSNNVCSATGMINGFGLVENNSDRMAYHVTGEKIKTFHWKFYNQEFFKGKDVIVFDDILTRGDSMHYMIACVRALGANVRCCITLGKTIKPDSSECIRTLHPYSNTFL